MKLHPGEKIAPLFKRCVKAQGCAKVSSYKVDANLMRDVNKYSCKGQHHMYTKTVAPQYRAEN